MGVVALPRIVGLGRREADWRRSRWLAALDERTPAELLLGWQRVVLVSPHPDDETLACGGLLHAAGAMGLDVHLVSVTDGEACYPGNARWTPERLRAVRSSEVAHALAALGVRAQVHRLGLPDGDVDGHREALEATLRSMLRPGDLVLAPWEQDGHPDHDAVGHAAIAAVAGSDARLLRYPVWAWHWLQADARQAPFEAVRMPLPHATIARKQRAIACFASQLGLGVPGVASPVLPPHVVERFERPFEVYLT